MPVPVVTTTPGAVRPAVSAHSITGIPGALNVDLAGLAADGLNAMELGPVALPAIDPELAEEWLRTAQAPPAPTVSHAQEGQLFGAGVNPMDQAVLDDQMTMSAPASSEPESRAGGLRGTGLEAAHPQGPASHVSQTSHQSGHGSTQLRSLPRDGDRVTPWLQSSPLQPQETAPEDLHHPEEAGVGERQRVPIECRRAGSKITFDLHSDVSYTSTQVRHEGHVKLAKRTAIEGVGERVCSS